MQNMNQISLDMYQTLGMAVAVLFLGAFLKKRIKFLETFCIPSPVVGGLIFAIVSCILYATGILEISFDETLKNVCMVIFFTSVGFQANLKVLKSGGLSLVVFLVCVIVLIISQNLVSVGLAKLVGVSPLIGLSTGSIPMVGGHGTAGAFGPVLEDLGISGASTLCTAAATFGLVAGSLMGGPIGRRLILKHDLLKTAVMEDDATLVEDEKKTQEKCKYVCTRNISNCHSNGTGNDCFVGTEQNRNDLSNIHRCNDSCGGNAKHKRTHKPLHRKYG